MHASTHVLTEASFVDRVFGSMTSNKWFSPNFLRCKMSGGSQKNAPECNAVE